MVVLDGSFIDSISLVIGWINNIKGTFLTSYDSLISKSVSTSHHDKIIYGKSWAISYISFFKISHNGNQLAQKRRQNILSRDLARTSFIYIIVVTQIT